MLIFDLVIGLTTYGRILGANIDDLRALHGMARIRHGYTEIAPVVTRYFTTPIHDDPHVGRGRHTAYRPDGSCSISYGLTTSAGMIGLITSMVAGVLAAVVGILAGISLRAADRIGIGGGALLFLGLLAMTVTGSKSEQARLEVEFPAPRN